jgi:peptide/nickel transport system permease protein
MWVYIVRRLLFLPVALVAVSLITWTLGVYGPGDPIRVMMGNKYDEVAAERIRDELGLNRPFFVQYGDYMYGFFQGDFGESLRFIGQPVRDIIVPKMWVSAQLSIAAMIISLSIGLPLGFYIAHKQGTWQDPTVVTFALVLMSIPIMVTVPALLWVGCLKTDLIPCSGWGGFFDPRIVVPAIAMGVPPIAAFIRLMRASTLDVMGQDFIRTAHAKGLGTVRVDVGHVLRNAMIPIITILAFSLAGLIEGSFIMETIMGIPGVGRFAVESIFNRDYPIIMAITLIGAMAFVMANLLADIAYAYVDPRIRYS